jgi:hypothetical protein
MLKPILICLAFLTIGIAARAQYQGQGRYAITDFQRGISLKLTADIQRGAVHPRLGIDAGISSPRILGFIVPALNLEYQLYYGGLGTRSGWGSAKNNLTGELVVSGTLTGGWRDGTGYDQPLYYFTDLVQPALQNPFSYSLSAGTNLVFPMDGHKAGLQRVGFYDVHIGRFQLAYYNDGGGMPVPLLADGKDRYYTGGGFINVSLPNNDVLSQFTASYHKFSGYYKETFEDTNEMNLSFVNYHDETQQYYNKSFWNLSVFNARTGLSGFFRVNNPYNRGDFQNTIHYVMNDGYHQVPYPQYYSFGLSYFNARQ